MLLSLNLTIPSEPTLKLICSFWCCVSEPPEKIMKVPLATRLSLKHELKLAFDAIQRRNRLTPHLLKLGTPEKLRIEHPTLYYKAFPDEVGPVPCRLDYKFDSSFSCRGAGKPASMEPSVDVNVGGTQAALLISMMTQFMQHQMHQQ